MIHDWRNVKEGQSALVTAVNSLSGPVEYDVDDHLLIERFLRSMKPGPLIRICLCLP